ncbi:MAG: biopolymer transporter ExbD [Cellvibrionaceae bacterium]|nr:biopolymer transporter ExbD [Cellvibrionaceae bacterium]
MKKASRRARRMARHHRFHKGAPLNLVSLMDIFTILVFFLLVNSSSAPQLPRQKDLALPKSTAQKTPEENVVLVITPQSVLLQGREVARVEDLLALDTEVIAPLQEALNAQRMNRQLRRAEANTEESVTIMGDENISYALLHKILATCQQANYTKIAFAAHQVAKPAQ